MPIFGNNNNGSTVQYLSSASMCYISYGTPVSNGIVNKIYLQAGYGHSNKNLKVSLYSGNAPTNLVSPAVVAITSAMGDAWFSIDVNFNIISGTRYWITVQTDTDWELSLKHDNSNNIIYLENHIYSNDFPLIATPVSSIAWGIFSAYAEYTATENKNNNVNFLHLGIRI